MKNLLLTIIALISSMIVHAQSQLQMHLSGGVKFLHPTVLAHSRSVIPSAVPTMGGGLSWVNDRIMAGAEFSYSDGVKESDEWRTVLTGVNLNILAGYRIPLSENTKLVFQSGFGYGLQHASVSDNHYSGTSSLNTAMYHNFIFTLPLSATVQRINRNGTFIALRASYGLKLMPNEWRFMSQTSTERFSAGADGLNLQVLLGGLLNFNSASR